MAEDNSHSKKSSYGSFSSSKDFTFLQMPKPSILFFNSPSAIVATKDITNINNFPIESFKYSFSINKLVYSKKRWHS